MNTHIFDKEMVIIEKKINVPKYQDRNIILNSEYKFDTNIMNILLNCKDKDNTYGDTNVLDMFVLILKSKNDDLIKLLQEQLVHMKTGTCIQGRFHRIYQIYRLL